MIAHIMKNMIDYSNGNNHDINHFIKVHSYAKTIGELENLTQQEMKILEITAIIHDIACPLCREKYGNTNGIYQEKEGMILAEEFLKDEDLTQEEKDRIIYLVGHHHTLKDIQGKDYQILIESDYLVNADESYYSMANKISYMNKIFKTKTGQELLKSIYQMEK